MPDELLPLHVDPELLRHLGRPDRRAAEHRLQRVVRALEADREPAERFLPLALFAFAMAPPVLCVYAARAADRSWGYYYHMDEGRNRKNTICWGPSPGGKYPGRVWQAVSGP